LKTDFELVVTFDWHSYARVILPNTYSRAVCGLCGDADGDPANDFSTPDGHQATGELQFGDSWKVAEVPGCWAGCTDGCKVCTEAEKRPYRGDKHCGLLVKKGGPFAACHDVIDPQPFFSDCLFDTCLYEGHQETVCRSLSAYVTACQSEGVAIKPWRTAAFCSLVCPPHQHYELHGPTCPPTCHGQTEPEPCEMSTTNATSTTEGCFCDAGFLRSGDHCVPLARCGCIHDGRYYKAGEDFLPDPRCFQRCSCRGAGTVECWPTEGCGEGEVCAVRDGVRGCYAHECGRCEVLGVVSYRTFDGRPLAFAGTCAYVLATVEVDGPQDPLAPFLVEVEKESGEGGRKGVRKVVVNAYGVTIGMGKGEEWEVDGERHLLPLALAEGALTVSQEGTHRVLLTQGGLKLLYDGDSYVVLTLPVAYHGRTRGLCGNFNGDPGDDLSTPEELGAAWGTLTPTCTHGDPPPTCPVDKLGPCAVLLEKTGPFVGCHGVVDPHEHVASCVQEQCGQPGAATLCRSLQAYAAACQAAGGQLQEWREATKCPFSCPPDTVYELCGQRCSGTCAGLLATPPCSHKCFEGCRCRDGFLFDGADCVPMDQCGC
ncbi:FCGBP protein, partial [Eurystomus gularis]|nr:FCGBP protein [Eurystomus gularis]